MQNINMSIEGNILTIKIDISKEYGDSGSGKSIIIASTGAPQTIPDHNDIKAGINVFRTKKKEKVKK